MFWINNNITMRLITNLIGFRCQSRIEPVSEKTIIRTIFPGRKGKPWFLEKKGGPIHKVCFLREVLPWRSRRSRVGLHRRQGRWEYTLACMQRIGMTMAGDGQHRCTLKTCQAAPCPCSRLTIEYPGACGIARCTTSDITWRISFSNRHRLPTCIAQPSPVPSWNGSLTSFSGDMHRFGRPLHVPAGNRLKGDSTDSMVTQWDH